MTGNDWQFLIDFANTPFGAFYGTIMAVLVGTVIGIIIAAGLRALENKRSPRITQEDETWRND